ncbi:MAG: Smr/MutS family protein [Bacteroidetes bacterium]|nr:Smr/MutS family protein [Bacteroidota bacterium]
MGTVSDDELKKLMEDFLPAEPKENIKTYSGKGKKSDQKLKETEASVSKRLPDVTRDELMAMMAVREPEVKEADIPKIALPTKKRTPTPVLDLHYQTVEAAREEFIRFMETQLVRPDVDKILIITGKGLGSENYQARIKPMVEKELNGGFRKRIDRWQTAPPDLGGSGAILVWLK